jgi:hypothetical protein
VVGQERFDELARGLATNRLSRGRVLRVLGSALVGGALASVPGMAWTATNPKRCNPGDEGKLCAGNCGVCFQGRCEPTQQLCGEGLGVPGKPKRQLTDPNHCTYCDPKTLNCTPPTKCAPCEVCFTNVGCRRSDDFYCSYVGNPQAPSGYTRTCDPATGLCSCDPDTEVPCKNICVAKCIPPEKLNENTCLCEGLCTFDEECDTGKCEICDEGFCTPGCPPEECCGARCGCSSPLTCCPAGPGGEQFRCVNLQTAHNDCGSCGKGCPLGGSCVDGECVCPPGEQHCLFQNTCVPCDPEKELDPVCRCVCPSGQTECEDGCHDLQTDPQNCGSCGNACSGGKTCQEGVCTCPPEKKTECQGVCRDLQTDPNSCGVCATVCTASQICNNGVCQCPDGRVSTICSCADIDCGPNAECCTLLDGRPACRPTEEIACPPGACSGCCPAPCPLAPVCLGPNDTTCPDFPPPGV